MAASRRYDGGKAPRMQLATTSARKYCTNQQKTTVLLSQPQQVEQQAPPSQQAYPTDILQVPRTIFEARSMGFTRFDGELAAKRLALEKKAAASGSKADASKKLETKLANRAIKDKAALTDINKKSLMAKEKKQLTVDKTKKSAEKSAAVEEAKYKAMQEQEAVRKTAAEAFLKSTGLTMPKLCQIAKAVCESVSKDDAKKHAVFEQMDKALIGFIVSQVEPDFQHEIANSIPQKQAVALHKAISPRREWEETERVIQRYRERMQEAEMQKAALEKQLRQLKLEQAPVAMVLE